MIDDQSNKFKCCTTDPDGIACSRKWQLPILKISEEKKWQSPPGRRGSTSLARAGPWGWGRWSSSTRPGMGRETLASGRSTRWKHHIFSEMTFHLNFIGDYIYLQVIYFPGDLVLCHPSSRQAALWPPRIKRPLEQVGVSATYSHCFLTQMVSELALSIEYWTHIAIFFVNRNIVSDLVWRTIFRLKLQPRRMNDSGLCVHGNLQNCFMSDAFYSYIIYDIIDYKPIFNVIFCSQEHRTHCPWWHFVPSDREDQFKKVFSVLTVQTCQERAVQKG